ncbi:DUF932 domain-containing protein [Candidatus Fermentibacterales bacterium]|nr:DUF932 domain-containing protein [Candidatus Fermentibacterales bacterium]
MSASRTRVSVRDPMSPVRAVEVRTNGDAVFQGIEILADSGQYELLNVHSTSYNLLANADVERAARRVLDDSGLDWRRVRETWTGRFWARQWMSDYQIEAPAVGDVLALGLLVQNSYDGSAQASMVLMAYVVACTNGLMSSRHFESYAMKHLVSETFDTRGAVAKLNAGMQQVQELVPVMERLHRIPLTVDLLVDVAVRTQLPRAEWGFVLEKLKGAETAYGLLMALTDRLSRNGRGRAGLDHQDRVGNLFFTDLVQELPA